MTSPPPIRAVVFDFDGVIADSEPVHERALLETVQAHGLGFSHDQYQTELIGYDDRDAFQAICRMNGRACEPPAVAGLIADKIQRVHAMIRAGDVRPFPGTLELARDVRAAGVPIAICSGALREEIHLMLEAFNAEGLFQTIVTADDVERAKPDPAGYIMAAEQLGVSPAACACIEDTPTGIAAALAAGYARVIAVAHSLPASQLAEAHAVFHATTAITLARLLDESHAHHEEAT